MTRCNRKAAHLSGYWGQSGVNSWSMASHRGDPFWNLCKLFYKRECQEKYSPAELEAGENRLAFSPLYRLMAASVVCRVTYPEGLHQFAFGRFAGFTPSLFLLSGCVRQNGPEPVKGAPTGAA